MEIKGIKYIAPCFDSSGYAQAARGYITALHKLGIPLTLAPISFEKARPNLGKEGQFMYDLVNKEIEYNVVVIHSTPEFWGRLKEPGKTNIGYTIWETSRLHHDWPGYINQMDKVLCGCDWNKEVFEQSGVTIPIGVVPHTVGLEEFDNVTPYNIDGLKDDTFMLYSIFQWSERKNPLALIKAYWYAFQNNEDVALVLKTYRGDYSDTEKDAIRTFLRKAKEIMLLDKYPPIYYISEMLSRSEILGLHARGNCYASLDRGEGFGLGPFEAGASGAPILVTGYGGINQYAYGANSYRVNYVLTPVSGMSWSPWYRGNQLWAEPDICHGAELMRYAYNHKEETKGMGKLLQKNIRDDFSWEVIGNKFIENIKNT